MANLILKNGSKAIGATTRGGNAATYRNAIHQYGITWTFDRSYATGQFITGDWWVIPNTVGGTVNIVSINPPPSTIYQGLISGGGTAGDYKMHGTMVNPVDPNHHGLDSRVNGFQDALYKAAPRRDAPLSVRANSSIISTISWITGDFGIPDPYGGAMDNAYRPTLKVGAVLTVLPTVPPSDAFRPPYSGTTKPIYRATALKYNVLPRLSKTPVTTYMPTFDVADAWLAKPWIDFETVWSMDPLHPSQNMPNYGQDMSTRLNNVALMCLLDLPTEQVQALSRRLVQIGIDFYEILKIGGLWGDIGGGIGIGRKWPIMYAGIMLDRDDMIDVGTTYGAAAFQEDCQTFYVDQAYLDLFVGQGFISGWQVGDARWGVEHCATVANDSVSRSYARCCTANSWHGAAICARYLGMKARWNHNAFFDHIDWYMSVETPGTSQRSDSDFAEEMWDTYRSGAPNT